MSFADDAEHIITEKDDEIKELRELSAELLAILSKSVTEYDMTGEVTNILEMRAAIAGRGEAIAKAEKLK